MTFLYFAYGSNMLPARLIGRCPSAEVVGVGIAPGYRLEFSKPSKDGSAKATMIQAAGSHLPGVIFEIDEAERKALDNHEGLGRGYSCDTAFLVEGVSPAGTFLTSTYLATSSDINLKPFDWYLATVIAGAIHHGMDEAYITELRSTPFDEDIQQSRDTRIAAVKAMNEHGIMDFRKII